ncbi:MAG: hypothetical protein ABH881_00620 [bacterium]
MRREKIGEENIRIPRIEERPAAEVSDETYDYIGNIEDELTEYKSDIEEIQSLKIALAESSEDGRELGEKELLMSIYLSEMDGLYKKSEVIEKKGLFARLVRKIAGKKETVSKEAVNEGWVEIKGGEKELIEEELRNQGMTEDEIKDLCKSGIEARWINTPDLGGIREIRAGQTEKEKKELVDDLINRDIKDLLYLSENIKKSDKEIEKREKDLKKESANASKVLKNKSSVDRLIELGNEEVEGRKEKNKEDKDELREELERYDDLFLVGEKMEALRVNFFEIIKDLNGKISQNEKLMRTIKKFLNRRTDSEANSGNQKAYQEEYDQLQVDTSALRELLKKTNQRMKVVKEDGRNINTKIKIIKRINEVVDRKAEEGVEEEEHKKSKESQYPRWPFPKIENKRTDDSEPGIAERDTELDLSRIEEVKSPEFKDVAAEELRKEFSESNSENKNKEDNDEELQEEIERQRNKLREATVDKDPDLEESRRELEKKFSSLDDTDLQENRREVRDKIKKAAEDTKGSRGDEEVDEEVVSERKSFFEKVSALFKSKKEKERAVEIKRIKELKGDINKQLEKLSQYTKDPGSNLSEEEIFLFLGHEKRKLIKEITGIEYGDDKNTVAKLEKLFDSVKNQVEDKEGAKLETYEKLSRTEIKTKMLARYVIYKLAGSGKFDDILEAIDEIAKDVQSDSRAVVELERLQSDGKKIGDMIFKGVEKKAYELKRGGRIDEVRELISKALQSRLCEEEKLDRLFEKLS